MKLRELFRLFSRSRLGQAVGRAPVLQGIRTRHYVNRVDEELGGDPRFFFILPKAKQTEPRNEDDGRIGVSQLRRVVRSEAVVVVRVLDPIFGDLVMNARF